MWFRRRFGLLPFLLFLLAVMISRPARAQTEDITLRFDPSTTAIHWTLGATFHTVHGTFKLKSGTMTFNPASGRATGAIIVELASCNSGDGARDSTMQNQVLESSRYPLASLMPTAVRIGGSSPGAQTITGNGVFTIHDADHPIQFIATFQIDGNQVTANAHFQIPYVSWGMRDPSTFILRVAKVVDVDVQAKGTADGR
jgi:polyisoprenoid-binding protein YceI